MANTNSARKAARKIDRRTKINRHRRTEMRNLIRAVEDAIEDGDPETATAAMRTAESILARAGQLNIIHRKTASRKVSRLYRQIFNLTSGPSDSASPLVRRDRDKEKRLTVRLAELGIALRGRSRLDDAVRDVAELGDWMDISARSSNEDGCITRDVAKACAAASVQVLVAGSVDEKKRALALLSAALDSESPSVAGRYLQERMVPCVTEITSDIEPGKPFAMGPIKLRVGASRTIRSIPMSESDRNDGSTLVKIPTWGPPLHFKVRVSAPHARVEPQGDVDVVLPLDRADVTTDLLIVPRKIGTLPLTIDYMLDGDRFARRIMVFEPGDAGSAPAQKGRAAGQPSSV